MFLNLWYTTPSVLMVTHMITSNKVREIYKGYIVILLFLWLFIVLNNSKETTSKSQSQRNNKSFLTSTVSKKKKKVWPLKYVRLCLYMHTFSTFFFIYVIWSPCILNLSLSGNKKPQRRWHIIITFCSLILQFQDARAITLCRDSQP